jgi:ribosomal protein S18 acetylase RimI-like enzyme
MQSSISGSHALQHKWRRATGDDVARLVALIESAYRGEGSKAGWTSEAHLLDGQRTDPETLGAQIADPKQRLLVFEEDGQIVACVALEQRDGYGYVGLVTVRPDLQGGGWGARLLAAAEAYIASEWRFNRARMTVIAQRPELIAWYVRKGYADTGETAPFPYRDLRFGEPRRDDLYFVVLEKTLA